MSSHYSPRQALPILSSLNQPPLFSLLEPSPYLRPLGVCLRPPFPPQVPPLTLSRTLLPSSLGPAPSVSQAPPFWPSRSMATPPSHAHGVWPRPHPSGAGPALPSPSWPLPSPWSWAPPPSLPQAQAPPPPHSVVGRLSLTLGQTLSPSSASFLPSNTVSPEPSHSPHKTPRLL